MKLTIFYYIRNKLLITLLILGAFLQACGVPLDDCTPMVQALLITHHIEGGEASDEESEGIIQALTGEEETKETENGQVNIPPPPPAPPVIAVCEDSQPFSEDTWRQYHGGNYYQGEEHTRKEWQPDNYPISTFAILRILDGGYFIHSTNKANLESIQRSGLILDKVCTGITKGNPQFVVRDHYIRGIWMSYGGVNAGEKMMKDEELSHKVDLKIKLPLRFILYHVRDANAVLRNRMAENGNTAISFKNIPPDYIFMDIPDQDRPVNITEIKNISNLF